MTTTSTQSQVSIEDAFSLTPQNCYSLINELRQELAIERERSANLSAQLEELSPDHSLIIPANSVPIHALAPHHRKMWERLSGNRLEYDKPDSLAD